MSTANLNRQSGSVSALPLIEMNRLYRAGFSLVPLGGGDDGKKPLVAFQDRSRLPFNVVFNRMGDADKSTYGIRLEGLVVVDIDTDTPAARALVRKRFGDSTVQVKTPRGWHHWFRFGDDPVPSSIVHGNIRIDFKSGNNSYVVGPGSIRPCGAEYIAAVGVLENVEALPVFRDRELAQITAKKIQSLSHKPMGVNRVLTGFRNTFLTKKSIEFLPCADSETELFEELCSIRDYELENPETIQDSEITGIAAWAWKVRLKGDVFGGQMSAAKIYNHEVEAILAEPNGSDALALLHVFRHNHAGEKRNGKRFAIATHAMAKARIIPEWSESRYRRAKNVLLKVGLLRMVKKGGGYAGVCLYQLRRLPLTAPIRGGEVYTYIPVTGDIMEDSANGA